MKNISMFTAAILATLLVGCTNPNGTVSDAGVGTVAGGAAGALLGSTVGGGTGRLLATGVGAVGGALVGNSVGHSMDKSNGNAN